VVNNHASGISHLTTLLQWLITRETGDGRGYVSRSRCLCELNFVVICTVCETGLLCAGISEVRLYVEADVNTSPGSAAEKVLCGLAGVLAPTGVPLLAQYRQKLDIGGLSALATNALAATLVEVQLKCCNFELQHWGALCSLRSLEKAMLVLQPKVQQPPVAQPPFAIQSMQLTNLHFLQFSSTRVELAAPLLAHATTLTALQTLYFMDCNLGTLPPAVLALHQLSTLGMYRCRLSQLPSLAPLTRLVSLQLPSNPALVDLRPALAAQQQLQFLMLGGTTPLTEATLDALRGLSHLTKIDISKQSWSSSAAAALGYLVQLTHDKGCKLIT
jgi:hypothetical protein